MIELEQQELIAEYGLQPFNVKVLEPKRTLCEKIMSLVRFSYTEEPLIDLKAKIRHMYDLHQLLQDDGLVEFVQSSLFDEMLLKVANEDVVSFKNNNSWLRDPPQEALIFRDMENVWNQLRPVYNGDFRTLVFADFPHQDKILTTLRSIQQRLSMIEWKVKQSRIRWMLDT